MKKEALIAIFIGVALGLLITFGAYQLKKTDQNNTINPDLATTASPTPTIDISKNLSLSNPLDNVIQSQRTITVSGNTLANNYVVVFVGNQEEIITADETGNFSTEVDLEVGSNVITVITINEDGNTVKLEKTIIVTDKFDQESESAATTPASDSAQTNDQ
ncbi:MAG: hypothetical protein GF390_02650 [Candidatus Pacebacteria bacterium]|nr:hypothetical protein [Candidatus Paceibacterota bacterium]